MNLEDKLKNLHLEADYLEAVEDMADEYGAIIMDADADTLRLVALNLARVLACHGVDGCIVPELGQRPECERRALLIFAHACQLFGRGAHDRPPEDQS